MPRVKRVWIEQGCIQCAWCNDLAPEVFAIGDDSSLIRGDARDDGLTDRNQQHVLLNVPLNGTKGSFMEFVAAGCPAAVIILECEAEPDDP